jgi:hypothetical protein
MVISIAIFGMFYYGLLTSPDAGNRIEMEMLLNWLYLILIATVSATVIFSLIHFFKKWRDNPKSIIQPLICLGIIGALFGGSYLLGNGSPLEISGYEGNENTYHWLKGVDMWIYAIYVLLAATLAAVFAGILWSRIKKTR